MSRTLLACGCVVVAEGWTILGTVRCDAHALAELDVPPPAPATPCGTIAERVEAGQCIAEADWWAQRAADLAGDDQADCRRVASLLRLRSLRLEVGR